MKTMVFDLEVLPRWWCMVYTTPDKLDELNVISSDTPNFREKIKALIPTVCWFGFNIKNYDLRIVNAILKGCDTSEIYELSKDIINDTKSHPLNNFKFWNSFNFSDLYDDWKFGTLKEFESNSGMDIMESSISFDKEFLTESDKEELIHYCKHDVEATVKLYYYRKPGYIDGKIGLSEMFDIPIDKALKSTNAKLCSIVLKAEPHYRPSNYNFVIPERVKDYIENSLPKDIIDLFAILSKENKEVKLFDNDVVFGIGGIHSTIQENVLVKADEDTALFDIDVTSYYPHLMMCFNYMSRNVKDPSIYERVYNLRADIKKKMQEEYKLNGKSELFYKYKGQQLGLKLVLNTTYGATKNEYNNLYDEYQASSLCYLGQLLLAALANNLHNKTKTDIIQCNTDGILVRCPKTEITKVKELVSEWEKITDFPMEYDYYKIFFQRDVNNYIGMKEDGSIVLKGKWSNQADDDRAMSNLNAPIAHKAVLDYYIKGTPIKDTIYGCSNPLDFCFTTKTGKNYDATYYYINNEPHKVNKINRVMATKNVSRGTLKKYKKNENRYDKIAEIPEHCELINGIPTMPDDLDLDWYVEFATNKLKELKEI